MTPSDMGGVASRWSRLGRRVLALFSDWGDWIFVPLLVQFLVVNVVVYPAYADAVVGWGTFQLRTNVIFPFTWASSFLLFLFAAWAFLFRSRLDITRSLVYAVALSFAATSLFEVLYQNVGAGQGVGNQFLEGQLINLSAIAFGFSSARYWRITKFTLAACVAYLAGWLLWLSFGYPQVYDSNSTLASEGFVFNAALKVGSYVLYALLLLPGALSPPAAPTDFGATAADTPA